MTALRTSLSLLIATAALAAAPGDAAAAPGDLTYDRCLANSAVQGCIDLPFDPLAAARSVAVSPDGGSVYVAASDSGAVGHLFRGSQGEIAWDGCLANDATQGCGDLPGSPLFAVAGVAVSPDGRSVYAASAGANSIAHFFRGGPEGQIAYDGCLADDNSRGCGELPGSPLTGAGGVTVSPDGRSVYAVAIDGGSLAHFARSGPEGQIAYVGCLANNGASRGCTDLPGTPLFGAMSTVVSRDGESVYVASNGANAIAHFARATDGSLSYVGCLADDDTHGCGALPGSPLSGAAATAVSADGRSVYVAANAGSAIAHFARGPNGRLDYVGCLADDDSRGCTDLPGAPLTFASGVATSRDGESVYVTGFSGSIAEFGRRASDGALGYDRCLNTDGAGGCVDLPGTPTAGARAVAVSADDRAVYVASQNSHSITHFARELPPPRGPAEPPAAPADPPAPPAQQPGPQPATPQAADAVAPAISRLRLTHRRFRVRTAFRYTLSEPASVAVRIERAARRRRFVRTGVVLRRAGVAGGNRLRLSRRIGRRTLRPGLYRATFTATDAAGNSSRPVRIRFRIQPSTTRRTR